jgi:hypothetical protein
VITPLARPLMPSVPKYRRAIFVPSAALGKSLGLSLVDLSYVRTLPNFLTFFGVPEHMINGAASSPAAPLNVRIR